MNKYPTHPITKETRSRNTIFRFRTRKLITEYIYEVTSCEKCKSGEFCSRDGDKWGCLPYGNIASHLNHIGHPTSRGNRWSNKTVRDQITWGMRRVTEKEKQDRIERENKKRNEEVNWETHELTNSTEEILGELKKEFYTIQVAPSEDIDSFLNELRQEIAKKSQEGLVSKHHTNGDTTNLIVRMH